MKFKFDENLPAALGAFFRAADHDVHSILDEDLCGASDPTIAKICQEEQRVLITLDLDFANIKNYPPKEYPGIIVLRLARQDLRAVLEIMPRLLALLKKEAVEQRLWIVDEERTRIRGET